MSTNFKTRKPQASHRTLIASLSITIAAVTASFVEDAAAAAAAADWDRFHGPNGTGISVDADPLPTTFGETEIPERRSGKKLSLQSCRKISTPAWESRNMATHHTHQRLTELPSTFSLASQESWLSTWMVNSFGRRVSDLHSIE